MSLIVTVVHVEDVVGECNNETGGMFQAKNESVGQSPVDINYNCGGGGRIDIAKDLPYC